MAAKIEFKEDALKFLKNSLENDDMEAINTLIEGKTKCNSVKKAHLEAYRKIIEIMSKELGWSETKMTTVVEPKTEVQDDTSEGQQKKEVCKFLKNGNCQFGRSGKRPDQHGKVCAYNHPPICKNHEIQGKCMNNRCKKLHFNLCRRFMATQNCNFGDTCRYFHPKGLKNFRSFQDPNIHEENKMLIPNTTYSYAQAVKKPASSFLDQSPLIQQPVISQPNLPQQSFLGPKDRAQQVYLDIKSGQKHIMELVMSLNQKFMDLEKNNIQM